jgi:uncharacterized membrane protein
MWGWPQSAIFFTLRFPLTICVTWSKTLRFNWGRPRATRKFAFNPAPTKEFEMKIRTTLYAVAVWLLFTLPLVAGSRRFQTINPFNAVESSARGINDDGDIVGDFATAADEALADPIEHGFLRHEGDFRKLNFPGSYDTDANGINGDGVIVGTYAATLSDGTRGDDHGYVRDYHGYHKLPDPPGGLSPDFSAISDNGDIVGVMTTLTGNRGFLLSEGYFTIIDCGSSFTEANGINDSDDIVGECNDGTEHGFLRHKGKFKLFDFPGATGTVANGISNDGDIVGTYTDSNGDHGFVVEHVLRNPQWRTIDCPTTGAADTVLSGINDDGVVVGTCSGKGFRAQK